MKPFIKARTISSIEDIPIGLLLQDFILDVSDGIADGSIETITFDVDLSTDSILFIAHPPYAERINN